MMNIPTDLLRTLVAVVDLRSFTKAAQSFGVTQPAVSAQIKRLQFLLGFELLAESAPGVSLTPRGQEVVSGARRMLAINDQILNMTSGTPTVQALRINIWRFHRSAHSRDSGGLPQALAVGSVSTSTAAATIRRCVGWRRASSTLRWRCPNPSPPSRRVTAGSIRRSRCARTRRNSIRTRRCPSFSLAKTALARWRRCKPLSGSGGSTNSHSCPGAW